VTGQAAIEMLAAETRDQHLNFESIPVPTSDQIRAARGLLNWSIRELSEASNVSVASLKRIEGQGETSVRRESLESVVNAFKGQGVRFSRSADGTTSVSRVGSKRRG
jgi:ribosome-binding protein aMBF1 (putative translation factor)